jgi:hypothetical protein
LNGGNTIYIGAPVNGPITLSIPPNNANVTGTFMAIKNETPSGTNAQIVLAPQSGVTITASAPLSPLVVNPGVYAQYIATALNTYTRLT